jgi:hypothetical protein
VTHARGCGAFWAWAAAGALLALSLISFIGVLTGPVAVVWTALVAWRSRPWPEPLGLLAGIGVLCLVLGSLDNPGRHAWLTVGAVLCLAGIAGYACSRSRPYASR